MQVSNMTLALNWIARDIRRPPTLRVPEPGNQRMSLRELLSYNMKGVARG